MIKYRASGRFAFRGKGSNLSASSRGLFVIWVIVPVANSALEAAEGRRILNKLLAKKARKT